MRDEDAIDTAIEAMENRIERDEFPLLLGIWHAKRDSLRRIKDEGVETVEEVLGDALTEDLGVMQYAQIQGGLNAAAWVRGDLDAI